MEPIIHRLQVLGAGAVLLLAVSDTRLARAEAQNDADEVIARYNTAFETWLADVRFSSHYALTKGVAQSVEDARQGKFLRIVRRADGLEVIATGVFNKMGPKLRCSREYLGGPISTGPRTMQYMGFDEVGNATVEILSEPVIGGQQRANMFVTKKSSRFKGLARYSAGVQSSQEVSPLSIQGGQVRAPCLLDVSSIDPDKIQKHVRQIDAAHDEITLKGVAPTGSDVEKTIVFFKAVSPPVVESINFRNHNLQRNDVVIEHGAVASEFVDCPGGKVPKVVVYYSWNSSVPDRYIVDRWASEDLGAEPVTDRDFLVGIGENVRVSGLTENPVVARQGINIDAVSESELRKPAARGESSSLPWLWKVILIGVEATVLFAAIGFMIWASRRRRAT
jgi:hypothetical protein